MSGRLWICTGLLLLWGVGQVAAQQPPPQEACEDKLARTETVLQIVREERDRAQQSLAQVWQRAQKAEQELVKRPPPAPAEPPKPKE